MSRALPCGREGLECSGRFNGGQHGLATLVAAVAAGTGHFLRFGRIALVYQTLDGMEAGVWNQTTKNWDPLDASYRTAIRQGLRIARKQAAPDLIRLPLPVPGRGES